MTSFVKLFSSITESTVWGESYATRLVWITMLAMADSKGRVQASIPGLAHRARVTLDECEAALETFKQPDRYSRTPDREGRRVEDIDGGWFLLNYLKYREERDPEERKEYQRAWDRQKRPSGHKRGTNTQAQSDNGPTQSDKPDTVRPNPTKEEEEEIKKEKKQRAGKPRKLPLPVDFGISDRVQQWANEKGHTGLSEHLDHFIGQAKAKGYVYVDWDQAFMNAIRDDWAKLGASNVVQTARRVAV